MAKLRKPANDAERTALAQWRSALPITAMATLFKAGYTHDQREDFQRQVAGCSGELEFSYSDYDLTGM